MNLSKSGITQLTAVVVMVLVAVGALGFADANGSDRHSEPEHQRITALALAWIEAMERGDLPVAASQCIVEPTRRHDLFVTLAVTSTEGSGTIQFAFRPDGHRPRHPFPFTGGMPRAPAASLDDAGALQQSLGMRHN